MSDRIGPLEERIGEAPRIPPLKPEQFDENALRIAALLRKTFGLPENGDVPDAVATMIRHPLLYQAEMEFVARRFPLLVFERRDFELIVLRTAWVCKSDYLWGEHVKAGKLHGLSADEIERIAQGPDAPGWNARDKAILQAVDDLRRDTRISDAVWSVLASHLDDKQLIELLHLVGFHTEIAYTYNSLGVRLISGNPGLAAR
jgi:4-carboxymuconolactone decarboxylase